MQVVSGSLVQKEFTSHGAKQVKSDRAVFLCGKVCLNQDGGGQVVTTSPHVATEAKYL